MQFSIANPVRCDTQGFRNEKNEHRRAAENRLYDAVERYFASAPGTSAQDKVRPTQLPPLYFQHRGKPPPLSSNPPPPTHSLPFSPIP